jgi:ER membrane protein complex subunit 3
MTHYLHLDASLRNWVFFPITIITIMVNLLVKNLTILLNSNSNKKASLKSTCDELDFKAEVNSRDSDIKVTNAISRSTKLRQNYMKISERGFKLRKAFFCKEGEGYFNQEFESKPAEMMNPNMMGDMIKKNAVNMLYYALVFVGCGYFFGGFILLKLPFGLTQRFRSMLQQGLSIPNLDISYVSAISWCFILVFGLNSIIQHFDGGDDFSMMKEQEKMMTAPMQGFGPQEKDYTKLMNAEKENIDILPYFSHLEEAVEKMISKYRDNK